MMTPPTKPARSQPKPQPTTKESSSSKLLHSTSAAAEDSLAKATPAGLERKPLAEGTSSSPTQIPSMKLTTSLALSGRQTDTKRSYSPTHLARSSPAFGNTP